MNLGELEPLIRLMAFVVLFIALALAELLIPARTPALGRRERWPQNLAITVIDAVVVRILFPFGAAGVALVALDRGWGLFHRFDLPLLLAIAAGVIVLDLAIYLQHRLIHRIPLLFRFHAVHHADTEFDVSLGTRFHPVEIILSMLYKVALVVILGLHPLAVLVFEMLLNATALFTHANIRLPRRLDLLVRRIAVTPEMHRIHHSVEKVDSDRNFGFCLSIWDRLFGSYAGESNAGDARFPIGLDEHRQRRQSLAWMLALPFERRRDASAPTGGTPALQRGRRSYSDSIHGRRASPIDDQSAGGVARAFRSASLLPVNREPQWPPC